MSLKAQMLANLVLWDLSIWLVSLFMVTRQLQQGLLEDTLSEKKRTFFTVHLSYQQRNSFPEDPVSFLLCHIDYMIHSYVHIQTNY